MIFIFILLLPYTLGVPRPYERFLDAPKLVSVLGTEPAGLFITWLGVRQRSDDLILGFKIKLWTVEQVNEVRYELINAEEYPGYVHDLKPSKVFSVNETLTVPPRDIVVNSWAHENNFHIQNLDYNKIYEVRVLAFKIDKEGPMSEPIRIKMVNGSGNLRGVLQKLPTGCSFMIRSQIEYNGDEYPFEHISYL